MPAFFQERVSEPQAVPEISAPFPRATPVETTPMPVKGPEKPSEETEDEETRASQESNMQRWTEMIECIGMFAQVYWLDDMANTEQNRIALQTSFMEGMYLLQ